MIDLIPKCEGSRHTYDLASLAVLIGVFAQVLPAVASVVTIGWIGLRGYKTWLEIRLLKRGLSGDRLPYQRRSTDEDD